MADLKTKQTGASVEAFLKRIDDKRRDDCREIVRIMKQATRSEPAMWGTSIVGFGSYNYKYDSGREGRWFIAGFSPRKSDITLYIMPGVERYPKLLAKLGPHKTGRSCLYIKRLSDVDVSVLKELVTTASRELRAMQKTKAAQSS